MMYLYPQNQTPCPTCGHCPTCGRGGHHGQYPYWSYPYWYITTSTSGYVQGQAEVGS